MLSKPECWFLPNWFKSNISHWLWERQSGFISLIESFKAIMASHFQAITLHLISSIWTEYARGVGTVTNGRRLPWKPSKTCPYQLRAYKSLSFPAHLTLASVFMPWFALFPKIRPVLSWCMAKDLFYRWLYQLGSIPAPDNCVILSHFKHIIPHLLSNELFQKLHWRTEVPLAFWFLHAS